ncbi:MAG: metallophosphoesterase [Gammaproteobacteria bacterium]
MPWLTDKPEMTDSARVAFGSLLLLLAGFTATAQQSWRFDDVERFVAVADIHGAYDAFEAVLHKTGIIDESLNWAGGSDHLIIVGDVLDRGPDSRRALDLIMRLQAAAEPAGGAVHFALGNHEIMNMTGDLRYVSDAEYAAFANDESADMRAAAFAAFEGERDAFDARYPAGFFAHRLAYSADGTYGSWLLRQPFLIVVNDWAFVHGGLAAASRDLIGDDINAALQQQVHSYMVAQDTLVDEGVLHAGDNFYDHPRLIEAFATRVAAGETSWSEAGETAANIVTDLNSAFAFDTQSPIWYRGNVGCSALIERERLSVTLASAGVERLVVGHTPTRDASVHSHLDGQLFRVDTGMLSEYYGGRGAALIVERLADGTSIRAVYEDDSEAHEVTAQPRHVGLRPAGMTAEDIGEFLATADVTELTALDARWSRVTLRAGDVELTAVFTPKSSRNAQPDLAAWRLDRLLGLDMVPVAVSREIDGEAGTLQYLPPDVMTEEQRQAERRGGEAWCPLSDQFGAMYVFDVLIGNSGRTLDRLLYGTDNFQVILVGHDASFPTSGDKPAHLAEVPLPLTPLWVERLRSLTEDSLEESFGDVLDRRRIRALLSRRDAILSDAGIEP